MAALIFLRLRDASRSEDLPTWLRKMDYTRKGRSVQATSQ